MSARAIRRSFAAPFIVTIATMAPVHADDKAPKRTPPGTNPPAPPSPPGKNPPAPREPAKVERHWTVTKNNAKDAKPTECFAIQEGTCPKVAPGKPIPPCNPPPPIAYTCPDNFDARAYKIVLRVGATECFHDIITKCERNVKCNPPPPRQLPCPR